MKSTFQIALMFVLALGIAACAPVTPATQAAAEAYHPLTTRTGMQEIDNVLDVLAGGDVEELRSLVEFTNAKCTRAEGLGGPPKCLEGEAEGAPVEVLPFMGAEGSFLRKEEIADWQGIDVSGVYAAYKISPAVTSEQYYPVGEYALMLVGKDEQSSVILRLSEGRIVRVDHLFADFPEAWQETLQREAAEVILPPVSP